MLGFGLGGAASTGFLGLCLGCIGWCGTSGYLEAEGFADFNLVTDKGSLPPTGVGGYINYALRADFTLET